MKAFRDFSLKVFDMNESYFLWKLFIKDCMKTKIFLIYDLKRTKIIGKIGILVYFKRL